jgi:ABC-2 type transport system ATP-binding protein
LVEELRVNFGLPEKRAVSQLSRGQKAKLGLLVALGHRPELLLLDEPSSGLDPLARRDILEALIRTTISEGRTVFFSSHMLDEIERVCDWIGFLIRGRIVLQGSVAEINERHRRLIARFDRDQNNLPDIPGSTTIAGSGMEWTLVSRSPVGEIAHTLKEVGGKIVDEQVASLEEVFLAYSRSDLSQRREKERG